MSTQPNLKLFYFPIAARGELSRLVAAVNGLELEQSFDKAEAGDMAAYGSPGSWPVLQADDAKLSQSLAIESYIASIAPGLSSLSPAQRAKDMQWACFKEDLMVDFAKVLFSDKDPEKLKAAAGKWFPIFEGLLPAEGFINGLEFPTMADLAVVLMAEGFMPYGAAYKTAGVPDLITQYPKFTALNDRTKAVPAVQKYLEKSTTMTGNPFGF